MGLADDLDAILADPALEPVTVRVAEEETFGHFDDSDELVERGLESGETVQIRARRVRIRTGALPGLTRHVAVTLVAADGTETSYRARDILRANDGLETVVTLVDG